eukprot:601844-Rhodomonas_salina.1
MASLLPLTCGVRRAAYSKSKGRRWGEKQGEGEHEMSEIDVEKVREGGERSREKGSKRKGKEGQAERRVARDRGEEGG